MILASLKFQKFVSLIFAFIVMKKGLSTSLPLIIYSSKHPFSLFLFPYNRSSAETWKYWKFEVCRSKGCKVTSCQSWSSREKVCRFSHSSPSVCKHDWPGFEDARGQVILKVYGWQLCSPLTYKPQIFIIKRSILILKALKISRG